MLFCFFVFLLLMPIFFFKGNIHVNMLINIHEFEVILKNMANLVKQKVKELGIYVLFHATANLYRSSFNNGYIS